MWHFLSYFTWVQDLRMLHKFSSILSVAMSTLDPVWNQGARYHCWSGEQQSVVLEEAAPKQPGLNSVSISRDLRQPI